MNYKILVSPLSLNLDFLFTQNIQAKILILMVRIFQHIVLRNINPALQVVDITFQFIFSITQKINRSLSGGRGKNAGLEFPVLAGSHLPLKNPALEFVKAVCQVSGRKIFVAVATRFIYKNIKLSKSLDVL